MSNSRENDERLNRLASEAVCTVCHTLITRDSKGKKQCGCDKNQAKGGGGLALPSFFSAILEELLDNGATPNDRLVQIVAREGANKTKKLAETWNGSWEFLTADLMNQLAHQGYVTRNGDDRWELGDKFKAGVRLETIPARKDKNRASGTTVRMKDEREQLNRISVLETKMEAVVRQPRGKVHSHKEIGDLRASYEKHGALHAITKDAHGRILDGRHRGEIDPNWPAFVREDITTDKQAVDVILEMAYWAERNLDKLSPSTVEKIKGIQGEWAELPTQSDIKRAAVRAELLRDATRSNRAIADLLGVSDMFVGKVRGELVCANGLHKYEFPGSSQTGKHSVECWCGEGTYVPKPAKEPSAPPKDPYALPTDFTEQQVQDIIHKFFVEGKKAKAISVEMGRNYPGSDNAVLKVIDDERGRLRGYRQREAEIQAKPEPVPIESERPCTRCGGTGIEPD